MTDNEFPSPFGVEGISTDGSKVDEIKIIRTVSVSVWSGRYFNKVVSSYLQKAVKEFPSPFGVEGISTA